MAVEEADTKPKYDPTNVAETAFHTLKDGNDGPVFALLEQGGDPNQTDKQGFTALHRAAQFNRPALVYGLLRFGANPNARTEDDWTPLMQACLRSDADVVEMLLSYGADANIFTNDKRSLTEGIATYNALMLAIVGARMNVVRVLLHHGAHPDLVSSSGKNAREMAEQAMNWPPPMQKEGRPEILELLCAAS